VPGADVAARLKAVPKPTSAEAAEQSLIGAALLSREAIDKARGVVDVGDFADEGHQAIWRAVLEVYAGDGTVDLVTVSAFLERTTPELFERIRGAAYLGELAQASPGASNAVRYAQLVRERALASLPRGAKPNELREFSGIDLIRSDKGAIRPCEHNARELILTMPRYRALHFDEFLYRVRLGRRDWTDSDERELLCLLQAAHQVPRLTLGQVRNAVQVVAQLRVRDSLRDFILSLPAWDGTPRIAQAFTDAWGAADVELMRAASRNFFVALIARALRPGAQVDCLWAFEGPQGTLKSRSMRALGGQFHAEITSPIGTHDFLRELRGLWIAEMSELDSLRGREASTVKRLLSAPSDRYAEKYQSHAVAYARRAVAIATTNECVYWQDSTGARRLVPVRAGEIRIDLIEANREQWFAEARQLFEQGASWWEFPTSILEAQEERQQIDPWEDTLRGLMLNGRLEHAALVCWPTGWISSAELMARWLELAPHQQGQPSSVRLGRVMRRLGYEPHRQGKDRERGWVPADTSKASDA
jgi:hypothetical protein